MSPLTFADTALEIDEGWVGYEREGVAVPLVKEVDLRLPPGGSVAIVGESGSGKSLTVRAALGLLAPGLRASGSFRYGGVDLLALKEAGLERVRGREIALMLQDPFTMLNPVMSVLDHLREMIDLVHPETSDVEADVARRLAEVGIHDPSVLYRYPHELSGGMRQRVALACALVSDPRVLIADEVTTGLDTVTQAGVLRLFDQLRRSREMSLVLITHDLRLALSNCDRIVVLYAGQVLEECTTRQLADEVLHPYTLGLMLSEPPADRRLDTLVSIPGRVPRAADITAGCPFRDRCAWVAPACAEGDGRPRPIGDAGRVSACVRIDEILPAMRERRAEALATGTSTCSVASGRAPLLSVRGITKSFAARRGDRDAANVAVRDASFEMARGQCVGLVGTSGSGKTTVARCVVGLETFDDGTIVVDGMELGAGPRTRQQRRELRAKAQMVFQDPYSTLNPALSIGRTMDEALRCATRPVDDRRAVAEELLARVGLPPEYLGRRPSALSGGERQRIAIARALALEPALLVCDEPVSALDVSVQAQVLGLIRHLVGELGIGCLFITHDLAVVRQVADWICVMSGGEIVEAGPAEHLLDDPQHPYTRELIDAVPGGHSC